MASPASFGFANIAARSASPPIARDMDALAVHGDFDLVRVIQAAQVAEVRVLEPDLEHVLAVEREHVANERPADGPERQAVDVLVLREILANTVGLADRRAPRIADRQALILAAADR